MKTFAMMVLANLCVHHQEKFVIVHMSSMNSCKLIMKSEMFKLTLNFEMISSNTSGVVMETCISYLAIFY